MADVIYWVLICLCAGSLLWAGGLVPTITRKKVP